MANYYKYADRDASSQINWAEVGKNMSDMLKEETRIRDEKKAAIDERSRVFGEQLANSPQGESKSANEATLEFAGNAAQYQRMQDTLLKSGQLRLSDYTINRQNLMDNTTMAFNMMSNYQKVYQEKQERYKDSVSSAYELDAMVMAEGFGDFKKSGLYIDPTSGKVSLAMKEMKNGVYTMSDNPNKRAAVNTVNGLILGKWNKYQPKEKLDALAASFGDQIRVTRTIGNRTAAGQTKTVSDILYQERDLAEAQSQLDQKQKMLVELGKEKETKSIIKQKDALIADIEDLKATVDLASATKGFKEAETKAVGALLSNPFDQMSLLRDVIQFGKEKQMYYFERDPAKAAADPNAILMVPAPGGNGAETPQLTQAQKDITVEWMRDQLRTRYKYEEKIQTNQDYNAPVQQSEGARSAAEQKKLLEDGYYYWNLLRSGTDEQKITAVKWLNNSNFLTTRGIESLGLSTDGKALVVNKRNTYQNVNGVESGTPASTEDIPLVDANGNLVGGKDWMGRSTIAFGTISPQDADKFGVGESRAAEHPEKIRAYRTGGDRPEAAPEPAPAPANGAAAGDALFQQQPG